MIFTAVIILDGHSSAEVLYLSFPNASLYMHGVFNANMRSFTPKLFPKKKKN